MGSESVGARRRGGLNRLKLFGALSRTPHGILDMTTPVFGACLWLGGLPDIGVILLGIITVFSGYTAVYALNDVVGYRVDRRSMREVGTLGKDRSNDLDSALVAHPMAQGLLSFSEGILWTLFWSVLAITGAYLLNPVCALIFLAGCLLEAVYCLLLKVSPLRTVVAGVVKTLGTMAAVYAVDPSPAPLFVASLFLVLFLWEIGGQNIPNDCTDVEGDIRQGARTLTISLGVRGSAALMIVTLALAVPLTFLPLYLSPFHFGPPATFAVLFMGGWLLLLPACRFQSRLGKEEAMSLFNRASYYPLFLFALVMVKLAI